MGAGLSRLSRRSCQIEVARQYQVGADPAQCGLSYSPVMQVGGYRPRFRPHRGVIWLVAKPAWAAYKSHPAVLRERARS